MEKVAMSLTNVPLADMVRLAQEAERSGFDSVWTIEFFNRNGFVAVTAMAAATQRVRVGTGIAYAFMRTPMLDAAAAMDIDELSGGRMVLGLGSGTKAMNEYWYSVPFSHPLGRMREAIELIRAYWRHAEGKPLRYKGTYYNIAIPQFERPFAVRPRIPIYLAGVNRGMLRLVGEVADGWVGHPIASRRYIAEIARPTMAEAAARAGRRLEDLELTSYIITAVHEDRATALREAKHQIAFYATVKSYDVILDLHGFGEQARAIREAFKTIDIPRMVEAVTDDMVDALAIAGTPDDCRQQLSRYDGLIDLPLFYSPSFGLPAERVVENLATIIRTFAR
ncbi:MAG: LLM class flavin-dependent oxidoreductase [Candidatus Tectomicrobia bacterium]|nr:LLM class flavin-dependent oxidoreductase [Candidatus Tectomicrobia bacterium]